MGKRQIERHPNLRIVPRNGTHQLSTFGIARDACNPKHRGDGQHSRAKIGKTRKNQSSTHRCTLL
jgi:hypothetical protein